LHRVQILDPYTNEKREMIMMASNDYLGLTTHPKVMQATHEAIDKFGTGSGGAPMLTGTFKLTRELEEKLAAWKGYEDAMIFPSGYAANLATISGLLHKGDTVLIDRLNHASIIDGAKLSGAETRVFRHNDMESLQQELERCDSKSHGKLIVVDGVFSMDGDIAPLPEILDLAQEFGAKVMVDEAHGTGVFGAHGRGSAEHFGLEGKIDLVMGTFSKALASSGAFLASSKEVTNYLHYFGRAYVFSTALPPHTLATVMASLDVIQNEPELRQRLWANVHYMYDQLKRLGFKLGPFPSPIIIIIIGDEVKMRKMSRLIHDRGLFINAVPYPAVAKDQCRLRISLMATHTQDDMNQALEILETVSRQFGII
jgi:glycine C-acetyltransferase